MGLTELKYALTAFRTKKTYLILLIGQLVLSLAIVVVALNSKTHFRTPLVLTLELVLFLSLAFDLYCCTHTDLSSGGYPREDSVIVKQTYSICVCSVCSQLLCCSSSFRVITTNPRTTESCCNWTIFL